MKKIQLLSVVFSLIMFTGVTAGTAIAFAESDDDDHDYDIKAKLDGFCEMTPEELAALVEEHGNGEDHLADIEEYCTLDDAGRETFIDEHKDEFTKSHDYDIKAKLDGFCEMSPEELEALVEEHGKGEDHLADMEEYCALDDSGREAFIEEHKDEFTKSHDYDIKAKLDGFCEMSPEELAALVKEHGKGEDHLADIEEYCTLDESGRDAYIEEHKDDYARDHSYKKIDFNLREKLDGFCEMSEEDKESLQEKYPMISDYQEKIDEYCSLDESEKDAYIEEHKDDYARDHSYKKLDFNMREKMDEFCEMSEEDKAAMVLEHQKSEEHLAEMKEYCSLDDSGRDVFIEEHKVGINNQMSDHKDSMISTSKSHMILRASTLTDEQKNEIKAAHEELRDFKHSLRDDSMSDSEKQEIRDQFMEKAKEFSMTWLSPRHQVAAGIDANSVECREGFALVMKTSNASPICVKETTAEKLLERGIVISSI